MASITFLASSQPGGTLERLQVARCGRTLMDVIDRYGLRHRCECRSGGCGKCAVKVAVLHQEGPRPTLLLNQTERDTLLAKGKLSRYQYDSPVLGSSAPMWRLACQYQLGEEDIVVAL